MEDEATFVRQRRNLFIISFAWIAAIWTNTSIKEFKVLDIPVIFPNELSLKWVLLPLWLYFTLRYWQVFSKQPFLEMGFEKIKQFSKERARKLILLEENPNEIESPWDNFPYQGIPFYKLSEVTYRIPAGKRDELGRRPIKIIVIKGWSLTRLKFRVWASVIFNYPHFTDYFFPFAAAMTAGGWFLFDLLFV